MKFNYRKSAGEDPVSACRSVGVHFGCRRALFVARSHRLGERSRTSRCTQPFHSISVPLPLASPALELTVMPLHLAGNITFASRFIHLFLPFAQAASPPAAALHSGDLVGFIFHPVSVFFSLISRFQLCNRSQLKTIRCDCEPELEPQPCLSLCPSK